MSAIMNTAHRSTTCGELRAANAGQKVKLIGWIHRRRDLGQVIFIDLRDRYGLTQIVFNPDKFPETHEKAKELRSEFVIKVLGVVTPRESVNKNIPTGEIEVITESLTIMSRAKTPPFEINDENLKVDEDLRLEYRYLDLRRSYMQETLVLRHRLAQIVRNYFTENQFVEVETPVLMKSTPEGARDYLVPSRVHAGKFYALPQSPQIYKQLLMVSGMDRYFQIVKCFRDEDLRADRQPEFTQVDVEMSFVEREDILGMIERLMFKIFKELKDIDLTMPLRRMPYFEAMRMYGSDKPDLRFGMPITYIEECVRGSEFKVFNDVLDQKDGAIALLCVESQASSFSRKKIDELTEFVKKHGLLGLATVKVEATGITSSIGKFFTEDKLRRMAEVAGAKEGDLLLIAAGKEQIVQSALGALRLKLAEDLKLVRDDAYAMFWVVDFPLFEYDEEEKRWNAMHHPFTSPFDEDLSKMDSEPGAVRAKA
ncbi:MAG TPA: aspartate--tRNA ligase, partial [bacterium]|nr:aspartate--tRNA ligase [bacterium]